MTDLPPPAVGQTWAPTRPGSRAKALRVVAVSRISLSSGLWVRFTMPGDPIEWSLRLTEWSVWAERHAARPVTE